MIELNALTPEVIQEFLSKYLIRDDKQVKVSVKRTSLGWLKIRIITTSFEGKTLVEREEKIDALLNNLQPNLNLGQYPISGYELLTPQEATVTPPQYIQLPLWSDILMAPEPDTPVEGFENIHKKPLVATFYSFKGGVGCSTANGIVAGILASRNRRVVVIDFDLEAPGISVMLQNDIQNTSREFEGVLDYLYQRSLTPEEDIPNINDCIAKVNLQSRGELFLVSAGQYNENYIHQLADLDIRSLYKREKNIIKQLIEDIKIQLEPDVILIDARSGFTDVGAIALLYLADTAIVCFSPTEQSLQGLRWVLQTVRKQREYQGKPYLQFLVTPIPPVAIEQQKIWRNKVESWIKDNWSLPKGMTIKELYHEIFYNPEITTLSSLVNDIPKSLIDAYVPLADSIDANLLDTKLAIAIETANDANNGR
ncbi:hypothetical protein NIES4071_21330 [Calothrix sp. NIES-4071]|nr:hypothetical protein NIES4071_21330 [Calothrix sp. NIES-4071]BAZ56465.1 hypothetical protein NIES4105_21280 [Calothrix sp. NIES-4105]